MKAWMYAWEPDIVMKDINKKSEIGQRLVTASDEIPNIAS